MKTWKYLRALLTAMLLALTAQAASAATLDFEWSLSVGADTVTGSLSGLDDNQSGQNLTGASITSSTLGWDGAFDMSVAKKNQGFDVQNGQIVNGHLKFQKFGAGTVSSPSIDLVLKWKNGVLTSAKFISNTGEKGGKVTLDFKSSGATFFVASVPLPPALPLMVAGLGGLLVLRRRGKGSSASQAQPV